VDYTYSPNVFFVVLRTSLMALMFIYYRYKYVVAKLITPYIKCTEYEIMLCFILLNIHNIRNCFK